MSKLNLLLNLGVAACASVFSTVAMASSAPASGPEIGGFNVIEIVKFLPFIAIFYYFMIHQPKKKAKEHQESLNALRKGDKVITSGGIIGKVHKIEEMNNEATIEIADNVLIQVLKSTLAPVAKPEPAAAPKAKKA